MGLAACPPPWLPLWAPPPPDPDPPLLFLLPPPLLAETAATCCWSLLDLSSAATTVEEAELASHTLSALSKTALKVAAVKSMSAIWFLTTWGRDRCQIPSTTLAQ